MLYIGIDLGTSAVKLLLMDQGGTIHKIVSKEYPLYFPHPGWSEQNPQDWFEKTMEGMKELTAECDRTQIARNWIWRPDARTGGSGRDGSGDPPCDSLE